VKKKMMEENSKEKAKQFDDLASLPALLTSKNIDTLSMLGDFKTNDEILKAYPTHQLVSAYGELSKTVPHLMRDKLLAKTLLQQYLTQGRFALTELEPAMKLNETLAKRYETLRGVRGASSDMQRS
jgi:hypothetical protein